MYDGLVAFGFVFSVQPQLLAQPFDSAVKRDFAILHDNIDCRAATFARVALVVLTKVLDTLGVDAEDLLLSCDPVFLLLMR